MFTRKSTSPHMRKVFSSMVRNLSENGCRKLRFIWGSILKTNTLWWRKNDSLPATLLASFFIYPNIREIKGAETDASVARKLICFQQLRCQIADSHINTLKARTIEWFCCWPKAHLVFVEKTLLFSNAALKAQFPATYRGFVPHQRHQGHQCFINAYWPSK